MDMEIKMGSIESCVKHLQSKLRTAGIGQRISYGDGLNWAHSHTSTASVLWQKKYFPNISLNNMESILKNIS
jgi:hypothetical protein